MSLEDSLHCLQQATKRMQETREKLTDKRIMAISTPTGKNPLFDFHFDFEAERVRQHALDAAKYAMCAMAPTPLTFTLDDINTEALKLIFEGDKKMEVKKDSIPHRTWEYEVAHPDMVCTEEISKYLSRTNPIVITKAGEHVTETIVVKKARLCTKVVDGHKVTITTPPVTKEVTKVVYEDEVMVFIHNSLIYKARILRIPIPKWVESTTVQTTYGGATDNMDAALAWAREVKSAKWGSKADRNIVRVIVPKI